MSDAGVQRLAVLGLLLCLLLAACRSDPSANGPAGSAADGWGSAGEVPRVPLATHEPSQRTADPFAPPEWLGSRPLPLRPDGFGQVLDTPQELDVRTIQGPDLLPPPPDDTYRSTISEVPDDVLARSTWSSGCPVGLGDLRYLTVSFWGFDDRPHTGELIVHRSVAGAIVEVFRSIHAARFPLEELRVIAPAELDAHPTGDGNVSSAFVCRRNVTGAAWSRHAHGLAVDLNPFQNPYVRGNLVVPELASSYVDRDRHRPGMIQPGDAVTQAFAAVGWRWGGEWQSAKDWMHFSDDGR